MDLSRDSLEFLEHFDGPKLLWSESVHSESSFSELSTSEPPGLPPRDEAVGSLQISVPPHTVRNATWVLGWAAAVATLFVAASVLIDFACGLAAEHALLRAARAAALEATLPRATRATIESTIARRLADYPELNYHLRLRIDHNNAPARGDFRLQQGDEMRITLISPRDAASPQWIGRINFWRSDAPLRAQAERVVPGRLLARRSN